MPDVGVRVALELDDLFGDQSVCVHKAYTQAAVKSVALRASAVRKAPPHRPRPRSRSRGLSASTRPRQTTTCTPSPLSKNTCVHSLATPSFPGGQWEKKVLCQNRPPYSREALGVGHAVARGCEMLRNVTLIDNGGKTVNLKLNLVTTATGLENNHWDRGWRHGHEHRKRPYVRGMNEASSCIAALKRSGGLAEAAANVDAATARIVELEMQLATGRTKRTAAVTA